jgi:hypothetical protein
VDDCLFVRTNDERWIQEQIEVLKMKYEEVTVEIGETINLIGMHVKIDYDKGQVILE